VKPVGYGSVKANPVTAADFHLGGSGKAFPVIGVLPGKIITAI
jgi:adenine deaminase